MRAWLFLLATACGSEPTGALPPVAPWLELGRHVDGAFIPFEDGDRLPILIGPEGGYLADVDGRTSQLPQECADDSSCTVEVSLWTAADGELTEPGLSDHAIVDPDRDHGYLLRIQVWLDEQFWIRQDVGRLDRAVARLRVTMPSGAGEPHSVVRSLVLRCDEWCP